MPVLQASDLTLAELKQTLGFREERDREFFWEWRRNLPLLSASERETCDRLKEDFLASLDDDPSEELVKLTLVAPLLTLAGLTRRPFRLVTERSIEIAVSDRDLLIRGRLDLLVLQDRLWVLVIEAKRCAIDLSRGLPQLLAYMSDAPAGDRPVWGAIANGPHLIFVKLLRDGPGWVYGLSDELSLRRQYNELYDGLQSLKALRQMVLEPAG